ncbi:MAG: hypothetical protein NTW75_10090 [Planctomycetales bacterium]|nr:hypothetical protein [Planctomycetales bacterium]
MPVDFEVISVNSEAHAIPGADANDTNKHNSVEKIQERCQNMILYL